MTDSSNFDYKLEVKNPPSMFTNIIEAEPEEQVSFFKKFDKGFRHNFMLMVISFFNGSDLLHVFARLNKEIRKELPDSGLLDQEKILRIRQDTKIDNINDRT